MMSRLEEGVEVHAIFFPDESHYVVGEFGVEKIVVVMQYGQMSMVPWLEVWMEGAPKSIHNGAHLESVQLEKLLRSPAAEIMRKGG